ncbi:MAG: hypothetical protein ACI4AK_07990 [Lepagella sp.]
MFLVFVVIAAVFWFITALNESVSQSFDVQLTISNIPDSVTFITDPPTDFHVSLRDKGTNILRSGVFKNPVVEVNFEDYARHGVFRISASDLNAEIKADLGSNASIAGISIDSLRLYYTDQPGRRVPIVVQSDLSAASGYVISGNPTPVKGSVLAFSIRDEADTLRRVFTKKVVKKDLSQSTVVTVPIIAPANVKLVPSEIEVRINVEPLVRKETYIRVDVDNLPAGEGLLLFPNSVPVSFYVPMSRFNDDSFPIRVYVDYQDTHKTPGSRIPLYLVDSSGALINPALSSDSVEYTLVKKK